MITCTWTLLKGSAFSSHVQTPGLCEIVQAALMLMPDATCHQLLLGMCCAAVRGCCGSAACPCCCCLTHALVRLHRLMQPAAVNGLDRSARRVASILQLGSSNNQGHGEQQHLHCREWAFCSCCIPDVEIETCESLFVDATKLSYKVALPFDPRLPAACRGFKCATDTCSR